MQSRRLLRQSGYLARRRPVPGVPVATGPVPEQLYVVVLRRHVERSVQHRPQRRESSGHAVRRWQVRGHHRQYARRRRDVLLRTRPASEPLQRRADDGARHRGCARGCVQQQRRTDAPAHEDLHDRAGSRGNDQCRERSAELRRAVRVGQPVRRRPREDRRHAACRGQRPWPVPAGQQPGAVVAGAAERVPGVLRRLGIGQRGGVQLDGAARADGGVPRVLQFEVQQRRPARARGGRNDRCRQRGESDLAGGADPRYAVGGQPGHHHV